MGGEEGWDGRGEKMSGEEGWDGRGEKMSVGIKEYNRDECAGLPHARIIIWAALFGTLTTMICDFSISPQDWNILPWKFLLLDVTLKTGTANSKPNPHKQWHSGIFHLCNKNRCHGFNLLVGITIFSGIRLPTKLHIETRSQGMDQTRDINNSGFVEWWFTGKQLRAGYWTLFGTS